MSEVHRLVRKAITSREALLHEQETVPAPVFPTPETPILYQCPACRRSYSTSKEAETCRDQLYDDAGWVVGDLVLIPGKRFYYTNRDGWNPEWVAFCQPANPESSSHFDHKDTYHAWWVITNIGPRYNDPHKCVVTVCSLVAEMQFGWNPANGYGHDAMYRFGVPEAEQKATGGSTWWRAVGSSILKAQPSETVRKEAAELAAMGLWTTKLL